MLNVVMLNVVMLNVVMLNVVMLNVAAPIETGDEKKFFLASTPSSSFYKVGLPVSDRQPSLSQPPKNRIVLEIQNMYKANFDQNNRTEAGI